MEYRRNKWRKPRIIKKKNSNSKQFPIYEKPQHNLIGYTAKNTKIITKKKIKI